jgi:hypothetical protein
MQNREADSLTALETKDALLYRLCMCDVTGTAMRKGFWSVLLYHYVYQVFYCDSTIQTEFTKFKLKIFALHTEKKPLHLLISDPSFMNLGVQLSCCEVSVRLK